VQFARWNLRINTLVTFCVNLIKLDFEVGGTNQQSVMVMLHLLVSAIFNENLMLTKLTSASHLCLFVCIHPLYVFVGKML